MNKVPVAGYGVLGYEHCSEMDMLMMIDDAIVMALGWIDRPPGRDER